MKVFYCEVPDFFNCDRLIEFLPDERRIKALRYRQEFDRKLCITSYLLLCEALKDNYSICESVRFAFNEYGKPYLTDYPHIFFNFSHCCCGVACAVSACEVGVDIQNITQYSESIARRVFCKNELAAISCSQNPDIEFTKLWTRKEAYLKMLGTGIADTMNSVDTTLIDNLHTWEFENFIISVCGEDLNGIQKINLEECGYAEIE